MNDPQGTNEFGSRTAVDVGEVSPESARRLVHELSVHQIELEQQNEELRRAQEQLDAARARYFDLYDLAPVGYVTLSEAGLIEESNLTAGLLLGQPREALLKQPLSQFVVSTDQDGYYHCRRQLNATGMRQVCELRIRRGNGETCWIRLEATAVKDVGGTVVHRAVLSDIAARKLADETLRASENRHRILFEQSPDAIMTLAPPDWRFTAANSAAVLMFGAVDTESFLVRAPIEYSPSQQPDGSDSSERAATRIATAMREGHCRYEWTHRRVSGESFPATVWLTRLEIEGQPLLHATVRDETDVKNLHAMLRHQDRMASMGILAAGVAHEINNPLTYVIHNLRELTKRLPEPTSGELTRETDESPSRAPPALVQLARDALQGVERIKAISKTIGTFSRVENTKRERVDLNEAVECARKMVSNGVKFRAQLRVESTPLPPISASTGKLSQVFLNLLMNASQAIGDGDPDRNEICVRTWHEAGEVFAEVRDTGPGISNKDLEHVFDPFFTTKAVGEGSGLGLAICRSIVSEYGGTLSVDSVPGAGARFTLRLPECTAPREVSMPPSSPPAPNASPRPPARVLVVDDEQQLLNSTARALGLLYQVVTANSGVSAQAILEQDQNFDLILCDMMMPGMTGMELHAWMRTEFPDLAQRTVFVSGGAFTAKAIEYLKEVDNARLDKPYEFEQLTALINRLCRTR